MMTLSLHRTLKQVHCAFAFMPTENNLDHDLFVCLCPYGPTGTTWVSYILDLLYFGKKNSERETLLSIYERVPFLELNVPFMDTGIAPQI